ncbi:hypothetical protein SDC9_153763 [bioreactor metagenome]|uniref:Uncharacterized protein n=1 Tax=bioreactor metagenome TaxID=1076179 RepID=A0A645EX77_9ZZZZ
MFTDTLSGLVSQIDKQNNLSLSSTSTSIFPTSPFWDKIPLVWVPLSASLPVEDVMTKPLLILKISKYLSKVVCPSCPPQLLSRGIYTTIGLFSLT